MSQTGCLKLFLNNTLKNTQTDSHQSWSNAISQLNDEYQHSKHREISEKRWHLKQIILALSKSKQINKAINYKFTLAKNIQGVVTPFEILSETFPFWPKSRPDSSSIHHRRKYTFHTKNIQGISGHANHLIRIRSKILLMQKIYLPNRADVETPMKNTYWKHLCFAKLHANT